PVSLAVTGVLERAGAAAQRDGVGRGRLKDVIGQIALELRVPGSGIGKPLKHRFPPACVLTLPEHAERSLPGQREGNVVGVATCCQRPSCRTAAQTWRRDRRCRGSSACPCRTGGSSSRRRRG